MAEVFEDEIKPTVTIDEYIQGMEEQELVVELWTKRNYRCDCGNSKFGNFTCKLFSDKDPENKDNSYNHNYRGAYCTCGPPYPDPDAVEQVEMIQCCICEDWFHENHISLGPSE